MSSKFCILKLYEILDDELRNGFGSHLEQRVKSVITEETLQQVEDYAFEYACREAVYLHLKELKIDYTKTFNVLCQYRRMSVFKNLDEQIKQIEMEFKKHGQEAQPPFNITLYWDAIDTLIEQRYGPELTRLLNKKFK
jgi:hypothetical protein